MCQFGIAHEIGRLVVLCNKVTVNMTTLFNMWGISVECVKLVSCKYQTLRPPGSEKLEISHFGLRLCNCSNYSNKFDFVRAKKKLSISEPNNTKSERRPVLDIF